MTSSLDDLEDRIRILEDELLTRRTRESMTTELRDKSSKRFGLVLKLAGMGSVFASAYEVFRIALHWLLTH